ncbi:MULTISPECIES: hypothetical protein [Paracoccus]|uniref:hypothetical protein n=1 Tax=Paracoccus TaxID=265 RepID=UPI0023F3D16D|nr:MULTISPECIES: hypothetical protein [Paracoccus]
MAPMVAVIWGHLLFVFPYVLIVLVGPWGALDQRLDRAAAALGAGRWRRLLRVKLPVLLASPHWPQPWAVYLAPLVLPAPIHPNRAALRGEAG